MSREPDEAIELFGAALAALEDELDWERLGRAACTGDGSGFYDEALRERVRDTGLAFADDLAARLAPGPAGRSLYVGAAVAELAPMLFERVVLGREVRWHNRECDEIAELTRALSRVRAELALELPLPATHDLARAPREDFDHLWMVSVLTDPECFPALHDELYQRRGTELATGTGSLEADRAAARALAAALLDRARDRALLSTTDEELVVLRPLFAERGLACELEPGGRISAIVGDRVRRARLSAASC